MTWWKVVDVSGVVRAENVRRVQLISCLLSDLLTSRGQRVLEEVTQFDLIVDLLFQVVTRYSLIHTSTSSWLCWGIGTWYAPSVADKDSDPLLVATSLSPPLSCTLASVHLLWRVLRPGINCRCTYEHRSQLARSRRHRSHISTLSTNYELSRHAAPL